MHTLFSLVFDIVIGQVIVWNGTFSSCSKKVWSTNPGMFIVIEKHFQQKDYFRF